jgi:hypothetical protein
VEDAADYNLRQQLRAAAAAALAVAAELKACQEERDRAIAATTELKACQEERDRAIAAAAQASAERDRAVIVASRNADAMQAMRRKIRANAAADRRRMLRIDRPERGVFDLTPDYAVRPCLTTTSSRPPFSVPWCGSWPWTLSSGPSSGELP